MNDINKRIIDEYILNKTAVEDMDIVIYDYQIDGIKTLKEAKQRVDNSVDEMLVLGYHMEERDGRHFFVAE